MLIIRMLVGFLLMAAAMYAYDEKCMPDLVVPTGIPPQSLEATIVHRFDRIPSGQFPDNIMASANAKIGVRYVIRAGLEGGAEYLYCPSSVIGQKEYAVHAAYSHAVPAVPLCAQAYVRYFGVQSWFNQPWERNLLYQLTIQSKPVWGRISPVVNLAYDALAGKPGMGAGVDVAVAENIGIVGEYYPPLGARDSSRAGKLDVHCFSLGARIATYGHHFLFTLGNSTDIGARHLMRGTVNKNLYFGFNLQRLFAF